MINKSKVNTLKEVGVGINRKIEKAFALHSLDGVGALYYSLGAPISAVANKIVTSADMKNGKYTIAAQPDVPRVLTCTRTAVNTSDKPGVLLITGTNIADEVITEVLIPGASGVLVVGTKAFKSIISVEGKEWEVDGVEEAADKIVVGIGALIGLPVAIYSESQVVNGVLGTGFVKPTVSASTFKVLEESLISMSWDGTKVAGAFITN